MTRLELRNQFRVENPEMTERVITDGQLDSFMLSGNKEICCLTRCIQTNETQVIDSVEDTQYYDLEGNIDQFYDIDDMPGGGVYYDDVPLSKKSASEMNYINKRWKTQDSGTPRYYWRRGKYLWLDRAPDEDDVEIGVDAILIPDDFNDDGKEPFNEIGSLQVYADGILKYVQYRAKQKIGKHDEAAIAQKDYAAYIKWMGKLVRSSKFGAVHMRPSGV